VQCNNSVQIIAAPVFHMPFLSDAQHATAIGATIALRSAALRNDAPPVALLQALTATIVDAHTALPDEAHRPLKMQRALVLAHRMRSMLQWRIEQAAGARVISLISRFITDQCVRSCSHAPNFCSLFFSAF
jgi:hypothetical protein